MKTRKTFKALAGAMAAAILLTGCAKDADNSGGTSNISAAGSGSTPNLSGRPGTESSPLQNYAGTVTAADIKKVYDADSEDVMPLYNVAPDETFEFRFKTNWLDADDAVQPSELVTVHTDPSCSEKSRIYTGNLFDEEDGTLLRVSPIGGVLTTDSEEYNVIENDVEVWGNASMYYIAIWYDTEAEGFVKLDKPVIIPFTVKHDLAIPTVKGVVDATGRFKLVWDAVEGATSYNIYWYGNTEVNRTGDCNEPVSGAESAYDVNGERYLIKDSSTDEAEFDCFAGKDHGLAIHYHNELDEDDVDYILGQNYSVTGSYFVTAVFGDKESGLSNIVNTSELILPFRPVEEDDLMFKRFEDEADLPQTVRVLNIDGSVTERSVTYRFHWGKSLIGTDVPQYRYSIEGTAITGECSMEISDGRMELYKDKQEGDAPTGVSDNAFDNSVKAEPDNETPFNPDSSVPTIIEAQPSDDGSSDPEPDDSDKTLVERQLENTEQHVENGGNDEVENTEYAVFAESAEEEWLARNLMAGSTHISLEAFPALQQYDTLADVFQKVYYQNPYVLGVVSYSYDYATLALSVKYCYDKEEIQQKQAEILSAASEIVKQAVTDGMTDEEKCRAFYDYFNDYTAYDSEAAAEAEAKGFIKGDGWKDTEDAFNAYGIIVGKKGVCQSYALSYKLLCSMSGVDSRVITGYIDGTLPHAWNAVKLDGEWYQTDCTNNYTNCGIPFFLYEAGEDDLAMTGYTEDKLYDLDTAAGTFSVPDSDREYYEANGLCADSAETYRAVLLDCLEGSEKVIAVRFTGSTLPKDEIIKAVKEVYNMKGLEDKLERLGFGYSNSFIILIGE